MREGERERMRERESASVRDREERREGMVVCVWSVWSVKLVGLVDLFGHFSHQGRLCHWLVALVCTADDRACDVTHHATTITQGSRSAPQRL
jgi:hypothetical protein